jgi:hypothetical protein
MAKFKFESVKFEQIMKDYATIREVTIPDAVMLNARLLCVELARRTQPFGENSTAGTIRVKNDIGKIIKNTDQLNEYADRVGSQRIKARLNALIKKRRFDIIETILRNIGFLNKWTGMEFISASKIKPIHKDARNKTTGRTKSRGSSLFVASNSDQEAYIAEVQKRVGMSKGGWANCATQLKRVNKGSLLSNFPKWVIKAMKAGSGSVKDMTSDLKNPRVEMTNNIPWASNVIPKSEEEFAKAVIVAKMKKQMEAILKKRQKGLIET